MDLAVDGGRQTDAAVADGSKGDEDRVAAEGALREVVVAHLPHRQREALAVAIDPTEFLLAPKYVAMMVMMPCLTIAAVSSGILAGGIFTYFTLDMGLGVYLRATMDVLVMRDIITSMIKAIVFGTIIVHVGCFEGFSVSGGPVGVGRSTTAAVVKSIFLVVVADLMATAFFYLFWR